jgi:hypothetical protein
MTLKEYYVKEKDGYLYIGGDVAPFIGKYKLQEGMGNLSVKN